MALNPSSRFPAAAAAFHSPFFFSFVSVPSGSTK